MKKFIVSTAAVAVCALGGIAHADWIDAIGNTASAITGVPYDPTPPGIPHVTTDAYGRQVHVDAGGRQTVLSQPMAVDPYGRAIPSGSPYAAAPQYDNDGDGVPNMYDRVPNDPRYR